MSRASISIAVRLGLFVALPVLTTCQYFGPNSIEAGRSDYNSAIQNTSAQQVLANIVRVYSLQMPLVMDVTQVNAALIVQGTASASLAGIGGLSALAGAGPVIATSATAGSLATRVVPSRTGTVGSTFEYEENPTITYTPLSGQPLIAQLSTQITVDSLSALPDSIQPLAALLEFAVDYLTPNYGDRDLALNAILDLDSYGALTTSAAKSALSGGAVGAPGGRGEPGGIGGTTVQLNTTTQPMAALQQNPSGTLPNDSLVFYLQPARIDAHGIPDAPADILRQWLRLLRIYWATQPALADNQLAPGQSEAFKSTNVLKRITDFETKSRKPGYTTRELMTDLGTLPNWIELRTAAIPPNQTKTTCNAPFDGPVSVLKSQCISLSPVMRTRSALGVLVATAANRERPMIEFVSPGRYHEIRSYSWNNVWGTIPDFYTLDHSAGNCSETDYDCPAAFMKCYIEHARSPLYTVSEDNEKADSPCYRGNHSKDWYGDFFGSNAYNAEATLEDSRRYILIIRSDKPPEEAFPEEPVYVSFASGGQWYFISNNDETSKRNSRL
jgi:hypothetical protein